MQVNAAWDRRQPPSSANPQGLAWDAPNLMRGDLDTGERKFGRDYYQDMMLWSLPAALAGEDLSGPCRPGGLVDRMIRAGRESRRTHRRRATATR